ncbi:uncharacterized protein VTP21DRAFT_4486 [Calcarisporiella thermophila]|uniref:uncharacterized protein n=1 Tax=Calcarisporiella thermophila TaxID=911321 RepID=UPI0037435ADA
MNMPKIHNPYSAVELTSLVSTSRAAAVFFTSVTCPPCRTIEPEFNRLVEQAEYPITAVKVDVGMVHDAGVQYGVRATPTFMFFANGGEKVHQFSGADPRELATGIQLALFSAYPPHSHTKLHLPQLHSISNAPILFTNVNADAIFIKLNALIAENNISLSQADKNTLQYTKIYISNPKDGEFNVNSWNNLFVLLCNSMPLVNHFPLYDIQRLLLLNPPVGEYYLLNVDPLLRIFKLVNETQDIPKPVHIMILRIACNLFAHPPLATQFLITPGYRSAITTLLISTLTNVPDSQVRLTAASLAFNFAAWIGERRKRHKGQKSTEKVEEELEGDWVVECVSVIVRGIEVELEEETLYRLICSLANFLFLSPDNFLSDLAAVLDVQRLLSEKRNAFPHSKRVAAISSDIVKILE